MVERGVEVINGIAVGRWKNDHRICLLFLERGVGYDIGCLFFLPTGTVFTHGFYMIQNGQHARGMKGWKQSLSNVPFAKTAAGFLLSLSASKCAANAEM